MAELFGDFFDPSEVPIADRVQAYADAAVPPFDARAIAQAAATAARRRRGWLGREDRDADRLVPSLERPAPRRLGAGYAIAAAAALVALVLVGLAIVGAQHRPPPTQPGITNGLIAFDAHGRIVTVHADATERTFITPASDIDWRPTWSRRGDRLAFWSAHPAPAQSGCAVPRDAGARLHTSAGDSLCAFRPDLVVLDPSGGDLTAIATNVAEPGAIAWAPNGERLAFASADGISIVDADGGTPRQVGEPGLSSGDPAWSPDGTRIAYRGGQSDTERAVRLVRPDGTDDHRLTHAAGTTAGTTFAPRWSPDGRQIAYTAGDAPRYALWAIDPDGSNEYEIPTRGVPGLSNDFWPTWSPDGQTIMYLAGDFPECCDAVPQLVAIDGNAETSLGHRGIGYAAPVWSPDGTRILVALKSETVQTNDRLMVIDPSYRAKTIVVDGPDIAFDDWQANPAGK